MVEEVVGPERERVWQELVARMSRFAEYQSNTSRSIPVLRLARTG